jgi:hypothetical protein
MWDISNVGHTLMLKSVSAAVDLWRDTSFPRVLQDDQDMFRVYFGSINPTSSVWMLAWYEGVEFIKARDFSSLL